MNGALEQMDKQLDLWGNVAGKIFSRHWLALFNLGFALYTIFPILAPLLVHLGHPVLAGWIYALYSHLCHQLPERSYFLFGKGRMISVYSLAHLKALGVLPGTAPWQRRVFIGNPALGYKMAFCQRCFATYLSFFLSGVLFGVTGRAWKELSVKGFVFFLLPMAIDGGLQMLGIHESNWVFRSVTGALFGIGSVWFVYPRLVLGIGEDFRGTLSAVPLQPRDPSRRS